MKTDKTEDDFGRIGNQLMDHLAVCEGLSPGESLIACSFLIGIIFANADGVKSLQDAGERLGHMASVMLGVYQRMADDRDADETKH